jgi:outer membrane protein OmpA-like peptidoglycan-associated protein
VDRPPWPVVLVASLLIARAAGAQPAGNVALDPFRPAMDSRGYLTVNASQVLGDRELSFGLGSLDWGHHLLQLDGDGKSYSIDDMVTATLIAAVGLRLGRAELEVGASLPLRIMSGQRGPNSLGDPSTPNDDKTYGVDGQGLGNAGLHVKARLLRPGRAGIGAGLIASVYLPAAGAKDRFLGDAQLVPQLVGVVDKELGAARRLRVSLNAGIRLRRTTTFTNSDPGPEMAPTTDRSITAGSELPFGLAAAYAIANQRFDVIGEVFGAVPLGAHQRYQPLEALAGVKLYLARSSFLTLGAGRGLLAGQGANPDMRAFIAIVFEPRVGDRDGDGIRDDVDRCPDAAEDFDGYQDSDGCPDPDNDGDHIPDSEDRCPDLAEDYDGVDDDDGCPEGGPSDRDGDRIPDATDGCPDEPEDVDGFQDDDGCPDPDNDGDRIPDVDDLCPNEPETYNGTDDADGCPDKGVTRVVDDRILILEPIGFEYDRAVIKPDSYYILDAVVAAMNGYPDITAVDVQGHTDERGDDRYNLELSRRRAEAVVTYLVDHGVAARRLTSHGYGETQPLDHGHTEAAWAKNRRVDFILRR